MEEELDEIKCFKINGEYLYLNKVLVDNGDYPLLFVCTDTEGSYYLCMLSNPTDMMYLVKKCTKPSYISDMILGEISLRDIWWWIDTDAELYKVYSDSVIENDRVIAVNIVDIENKELPEDSNYIIPNSEIKEYAEFLAKL
ncbi:hypothetical protein [uncultured Clostridium sp.]|uniref:hypothetical protein n=1 Tax=uncultured Clostridium sp. TaxID=59620 RepID=UPI00263A8D88|nr:hypothetical protein [uncultured Clostridium sp.]